MNRFLTYVLRFILIAIGFILAIVVASLFILALFWGGLVQAGDAGDTLLQIAFIIAVPLTVGTVGYYAFFPFMVFALIAELAAKRGWLTHVLGGMGIALFPFGIMSMRGQPQADMFALALAAGAVGGFVYWLVAGRSAGQGFERSAISASSKS